MAGPNVFILTGSGISKESGIPTFRDAQTGLWSRYRPEELATPEAFARDPGLVHAFYNARRRQLFEPAIAPNPAHQALARLQREWEGELTLVTQNVDNLHERAGSDPVWHMHGRIDHAACFRCGASAARQEDLSTETQCPSCGSAAMRPDVVWFGEMPRHMDAIYAALARADVFAAIGTSGHVYPAAGFVQQAPPRARRVEINLERSLNADLFDEGLYGPATAKVPEWVEGLLGKTALAAI